MSELHVVALIVGSMGLTLQALIYWERHRLPTPKAGGKGRQRQRSKK